MTFLLLSMVLVVATFMVVRPAMAAGPKIPLIGANLPQLLLILAVFAALTAYGGPVASLSLASAVLLHELGHVLAHRIAGHSSVRFRLVPHRWATPVSDQSAVSDAEVFFTTLMGPALSIAPMALAFALSDLFTGSAAQHIFGKLALTLGAFNFIALLPLWPLPGGTLVKLITRDRVSRVSTLPAAAFVVGLIALGWSLEAPVLVICGVIGGVGFAIQPRDRSERIPMSAREARLALAAYFFTFATFFLGGWWIILLAAGRF